MGSTVGIYGKATFGYWGTLPAGGTSSLIVALIKQNAGWPTGFPSDATIDQCQFFSTVLALTNVAESNATNYARVTVTSPTVTYAGEVVTLNAGANFTWTSLGAATGGTNNALAKLILGYKPTSGSADTAILLLGQYDFVGTTDGSNVTAQINASGLMSST
jgi:hypothetical protein